MYWIYGIWKLKGMSSIAMCILVWDKNYHDSYNFFLLRHFRVGLEVWLEWRCVMYVVCPYNIITLHLSWMETTMNNALLLVGVGFDAEFYAGLWWRVMGIWFGHNMEFWHGIRHMFEHSITFGLYGNSAKWRHVGMVKLAWWFSRK